MKHFDKTPLSSKGRIEGFWGLQNKNRANFHQSTQREEGLISTFINFQSLRFEVKDGWKRNTPWRFNIDTKETDGLENVFPAASMENLGYLADKISGVHFLLEVLKNNTRHGRKYQLGFASSTLGTSSMCQDPWYLWKNRFVHQSLQY